MKVREERTLIDKEDIMDDPYEIEIKDEMEAQREKIDKEISKTKFQTDNEITVGTGNVVNQHGKKKFVTKAKKYYGEQCNYVKSGQSHIIKHELDFRKKYP